MFKKVFYSPGPYATTDTYEVVEFDSEPDEIELTMIGEDKAYDHYQSYGDFDDEEEGIEPEYDYCWFDIDDPRVEGHI